MIGVLGFVFWWTKQFDLTTEHIPVIIAVGFIGPLSFLMGWLIHGGTTNHVVLFKKRTN
jgi:hypothetical protein